MAAGVVQRFDREAEIADRLARGRASARRGAADVLRVFVALAYVGQLADADRDLALASVAVDAQVRVRFRLHHRDLAAERAGVDDGFALERYHDVATFEASLLGRAVLLHVVD